MVWTQPGQVSGASRPAAEIVGGVRGGRSVVPRGALLPFEASGYSSGVRLRVRFSAAASRLRGAFLAATGRFLEGYVAGVSTPTTPRVEMTEFAHPSGVWIGGRPVSMRPRFAIRNTIYQLTFIFLTGYGFSRLATGSRRAPSCWFSTNHSL